MSDLKTPNDYRLFNFDFVDANFDDLYRCQVVLKMFLEINVIEKFSLSYEVRAKFHYTDTDTGPTRLGHHGLFCGETDPHGPNGVSPQKSPCPCPCSGI